MYIHCIDSIRHVNLCEKTLTHDNNFDVEADFAMCVLHSETVCSCII